jgi:FkbM family methyltransferase
MGRIKNTIRSFIQRKGYDVVKIYKKTIINGEQRLKIGNIELKMPSDHTLPFVLNTFPIYSRNLPRIVSDIRKKYNHLSIIDIGANIGDTVALILEVCDNISFYCIEGDSNYLSYLKKNISHIPNINVIETFLSDNNNEINGDIIIKDGTARIINNNSENHVNFQTLDNLFSKNVFDYSAKILKIDTDGFDMKIIRGGLKFIHEVKPIIFFEYDREYLDANNDDGISTIEELNQIGYKYAMFYDNYGRLLVCVNLNDIEIIKQLDLYIKGKKGAFEYFDICLFHEEDLDLYKTIKEKENHFFDQYNS